jgi:hypothetical protein
MDDEESILCEHAMRLQTVNKPFAWQIEKILM